MDIIVEQQHWSRWERYLAWFLRFMCGGAVLLSLERTAELIAARPSTMRNALVEADRKHPTGEGQLWGIRYTRRGSKRLFDAVSIAEYVYRVTSRSLPAGPGRPRTGELPLIPPEFLGPESGSQASEPARRRGRPRKSERVAA